MADPNPGGPEEDPFQLARFIEAQKDAYREALRQIRAARKQSHWMWFVFPQLRGLGASATSARYAISGLDEARAYLAHRVLGPRLVECCEAVLAAEASAHAMFGSPDDMKLRSCVTLFAGAAPGQPVFQQVIVRKYGGGADPMTLQLLGDMRRLDP